MLRIKHFLVIIRTELISLLGFLKIKDILRKSVEQPHDINHEHPEIDNTLKNIFVLPNIPWSFRKQRPQQISKLLGRKGYNVFYISPYTSQTEYIEQVDENVYEVHLFTTKSGNVLRDFHLDARSVLEFTKSFNTILEKYIQKDSYLFVLHPVWKDIAFGLNNMRLGYDLMDLYSGFSGARKELVEGEEQLIRKSEVVLASAQKLYDFAKGLNENTNILRNGCEFDHFNLLVKNGTLQSLEKKKIVGYFGAITSWFDVSLMEYVISKNPDIYFVFLGALNTTKIRRLYRYSNVYFLGEISYSDLPGYLGYFDVCTIPFIVNDLTLNTNPVKFYEYISSGKPVVSVRLPELDQYSELCYLAENKEDFNTKLHDALNENNLPIVEKRIKLAKENSWENRVDKLISLLK